MKVKSNLDEKMTVLFWKNWTSKIQNAIHSIPAEIWEKQTENIYIKHKNHNLKLIIDMTKTQKDFINFNITI